ncbi:helix-turn-helix domain-containing protein [Thiolapillus sp.]|uniref:helix-turn-helix domain-containing protein n=1 Tax=Thiolapillus sp. TaxID=2017437 RepID=UPI003AF472A5
MIAPDFPPDAYCASGTFNRYANPPAIHLMLPEGEGPKQLFSLYQGSGGVVASLLSITPSGANTQVHTAPQNKLATVVNEISLAFGLTKEELAQVCNVQSRKTLYNWINGEAKPRKSAMSRIFDLLVIARAWISSGFTTDREQLHEPVLGNQSVFDLLSQSEIDKERILFAGSRLNMLSPAKDELSDPFA